MEIGRLSSVMWSELIHDLKFLQSQIILRREHFRRFFARGGCLNGQHKVYQDEDYRGQSFTHSRGMCFAKHASGSDARVLLFWFYTFTLGFCHSVTHFGMAEPSPTAYNTEHDDYVASRRPKCNNRLKCNKLVNILTFGLIKCIKLLSVAT